MRRVVWLVLVGLLVILLALSVWGEVWVLPNGVERTATAFPEVEPLTGLALVWGVVAITCCQAILVIALRLLALARDRERFRSSAYRWIRAVVGCLLFLVAWIVAAIVLLSVNGYSSPLMFMLAVAGVVALGTALFLATSRVTRQSFPQSSDAPSAVKPHHPLPVAGRRSQPGLSADG